MIKYLYIRFIFKKETVVQQLFKANNTIEVAYY